MARGGKGKGPGAWQSSAAYRVVLKQVVEARKAAGMTQRDVAKVLNKPPSWIARIESKERRMDLIEFVAIARALGLKEVELFREIAAALPRRVDI